MTSTSARLFLLDRYEQIFKIRNHDDPTDSHPYGPILMNDCEDAITNGAVHERMKEYKSKRINEHFGLSFTEFIDQPTYRVVEMLKLASASQKKDQAIIDDIDRMEQAGRSGSKTPGKIGPQ